MIPPGWITFPAGILIASAVSAIGLGGGVLWMPFFLIVFKLEPKAAVLTSLLIQIAGMASGSIAFTKQKKVDHRLALFLLMMAMPGIIGGAWIAKHISRSYMEMILGILVMLIAFLFVSSNQKYEDLGEPRVSIPSAYRHSWVVFPASVLNGMLSVSMSEWLIPVMRSKMNLRMSSAIGTCIFIAFGTCLFGASIHLILGARPDWQIVLWGIPGVIIGGQIGPRITQHINERILKEMFIFLLTLLGIHLIYHSY